MPSSAWFSARETARRCLLANQSAWPRRASVASAARRRGNRMKRRQFMTLLGGTAAAWPFAARAQQPERMRRIGVLLPAAADDPVFQARLAAFHQGLALLGWIIGRNVRIDVHWATANAAEIRRHAAELCALAPDVILATGDSTMPPLLQATRTVPIVFPVVRSGWRRLRRQPGAAGRQRHRVHDFRI